MTEAVIRYDRELPEIPGPLPVGAPRVAPGQGRRRADRLAGGRGRPRWRETSVSREEVRQARDEGRA